MKRYKKIINIYLLITILLVMMSTNVFANEARESDDNYYQTVEAGKNFKFSYSYSNDKFIAKPSDSSILSLVQTKISYTSINQTSFVDKEYEVAAKKEGEAFINIYDSTTDKIIKQFAIKVVSPQYITCEGNYFEIILSSDIDQSYTMKDENGEKVNLQLKNTDITRVNDQVVYVHKYQVKLSIVGQQKFTITGDVDQLEITAYVNVKKHEFDEGRIVKKATCTEKGKKVFTCKNCDGTKSEEIPSLGHDYNEEWTIDVEPKCEVEGEKSHHCNRCSERKDITPIPSLGHDFNTEWTIDKEAKCEAEGSKSHHCKRCDKKEDIVIIPATGHGETEIKNIKDSTCEEDGCTGDIVCKKCGKILEKGDIITKKGHSWDEGKIVKEATCTTKGEKVYVCTSCNKTKSEEISATGHDIELQNVKETSCEENGYTGDEVCKKCHQIIKEGNVISAIGHSFGEYKVVKEATCTEKGEEESVCSNCGETKTREIAMKGHTRVATVEIPATCTEEGYTREEYCSRCGEIFEEKTIIPALGHKSDNGTITVQPTETKAGIKTYKCTVCGEILKEESIPVTGKKDNTKPNPTIKPSTPSLKIGTKVTDKKTKAVYKVTGKNTVEYVKTTSKAKSITIPAIVTVNGVKYQVISIAVKAFVNNKKLTKVVIPTSIKNIGKQAFSGCKNLKSITIKTPYLTNKSVGAKAFKGIHAKATIKVPKKQKKAYQKLLKARGIGKSVKVK